MRRSALPPNTLSQSVIPVGIPSRVWSTLCTSQDLWITSTKQIGVHISGEMVLTSRKWRYSRPREHFRQALELV